MELSPKEKDITGYQKLLFILETILDHLKIIESKNKGDFNDELKKLREFNADAKENNWQLFEYFLQQLFLDNEKEFDFNLSLLIKIIPKEIIIKVFTELKDGIEVHNFFNFLIKIGTLFASFYFVDETVQKFLEDNIHNCKNLYECILFILFSCKTKNNGEWFLGIYREYYQLKYEDDILLRLISSTKKHFNLLYGEEFSESSDEEENEENEQEEKSNTLYEQK